MCITVLAFIFGVAGFFGPVHVPDGKQGTITYQQVGSKTHCQDVAFDIPDIDPLYFCKVS